MREVNNRMRNNLLSNIEMISQRIKQNCQNLTMESEDDRARMALFIYDNFCLKDWRISITQYHQDKPPMPGKEQMLSYVVGVDHAIDANDAGEVVIDDDDFNEKNHG